MPISSLVAKKIATATAPPPSNDDNEMLAGPFVDTGTNVVDKSKKSLFRKMAESQMTDLGIGPPVLGVVAGSKGGQALADMLMGEAEDLTPITAAKRFIQLKYPKLVSNVPGGMHLVNALPNGASGNFIPSGMPYIQASTKYGTQAPLDITNTLGHELTHGGIQAIRTPEMIGADYIHYGPFQMNYKDPANFSSYFEQPAEVNARQGGATAENTLLKFLHTYPQLMKLFGPNLDK